MTITATIACARCSGRMFIDRETGEDFCITCGHRPKWRGVPSFISDTSVDYMGTAFVMGVESTVKQRAVRRLQAVYSPPTGTEVETLYWMCIVRGARIPWGELCFWPRCGLSKVERGLCRGHHTAVLNEGSTPPLWRKAAAQQFGWTRVEYEQWRQGKQTYTRVSRVWWPAHISHTTAEIVYRVMRKFRDERGYQLRRFRAVLDTRNANDSSGLFLVDKLSDDV